MKMPKGQEKATSEMKTEELTFGVNVFVPHNGYLEMYEVQMLFI